MVLVIVGCGVNGSGITVGVMNKYVVQTVPHTLDDVICIDGERVGPGVVDKTIADRISNVITAGSKITRMFPTRYVIMVFSCTGKAGALRRMGLTIASSSTRWGYRNFS